MGSIGANISVQNSSLANAGTLTIALPDTHVGGILSVGGYRVSNEMIATSKIIALTSRLGTNGQTTLLTQNGGTGPVSYTITIDASNNLIFTNTDGNNLVAIMNFNGFNS